MSLNFTAAGKIAYVEAASQLSNLDPVTYIGWINMNSLPAGAVIASIANKTQRVFGIDSNGKLYFKRTRATVDLSVVSTTAITLEKWTFVALTMTGTTIKMYAKKMGEFLKDMGAVVTAGSGAYTSDAASNMNLGTDDGSNPLGGQMSNFTVFNKVMTEPELRILAYSANSLNKYCIGHWRFPESGTTPVSVEDSSVNNNKLILAARQGVYPRGRIIPVPAAQLS